MQAAATDIRNRPPDMPYESAINTKESWKQHMGPCAREAEDFLWNLGKISYSKCDLCGTGAQGMETHLVGQAHWKKLGAHFNWQLPPPDIANDHNKPWVEHIPTPKGPYFFNHVTGQHGFLSENGESSNPPQEKVSSPYQPAVAPSPYPKTTTTAHADLQNNIKSNDGAQIDLAFENALMSREKGAWRKFMEPLATAAAEELTRLSGSWDYSCPVCQQDNTRGLADHVPSEKHWKKLGERINWRPPPPQDAHAMDKQWVQKIPTGRGTFLFNHLSGKYGLEELICPPCGANGTSTSMTPVAKPVVPPAPKPVVPIEPKFNHAHWLWMNTVRTGAEQVEELTSHHDFAGDLPKCKVCNSSVLTKQHLLSLEHYNALQSTCATINGDIVKEAMDGNNTRLETTSQPWVQALELHGRTYHFNHITGKELWRTW